MYEKKLHVLELFGGIGAFSKAIKNMGIPTKLIDYVEILPHAVNAYNAIHNPKFEVQNIIDWNLEVDIVAHGSPCQDFSKNGKGEVKTGGRSILYQVTLDIIENRLIKKPKIVIWENVPNLLANKHKYHFDMYLSEMERMGYVNSFSKEFASDYGIPQKRERVYVVSILNGPKFDFNLCKTTMKPLTDYLDKNPTIVNPSENEMGIFFKSNKKLEELLKLNNNSTTSINLDISEEYKRLLDIRTCNMYESINEFVNSSGNLYLWVNTMDGIQEISNLSCINLEQPNSKTRRGRVQHNCVPTITTSPRMAIYIDGVLRMLTSSEYFKLMGFTTRDYENCKKAGLNDTKINFVAGNSICVPVLEEILSKIFKIALLEFFSI